MTEMTELSQSTATPIAQQPDQSQPKDSQPGMLVLFLINLVLAAIWVSFIKVNPAIDYALGVLIGIFVLGIIYRDYFRRCIGLLAFIPYVLWQILRSNLSMAWTVVQPEKELNKRLHPTIVAIPLTVSTDLEITLLATIITLTPGTLSMDLGTDESGQPLLYVHSLLAEKPEEFRDEILTNFEQPILKITRAGTS